MCTIKDALFAKSNDYSTEERRFKEKTGFDLVNNYDEDIDVGSVDEPLSIIVACYKGQSVLPLLLTSLNDQTFKKFEVVLVDDGSPESMLNCVAKAQTNFPVKYIHQVKNMGHTFTRNTGIRFSDSKSLIFMDQDIVPHRYFVQNFAIRQNHTVFNRIHPYEYPSVDVKI